jgi:hyperosmotically inducible protein
MNTRIAGCLILCALIGPAAIAASNSETRSDTHSAAAFVSNSAITAKVKANLTADTTSNLSSVDVDTDKKGEVWLSGTVDSQSVADNAVQIAKSTKGVAAVHSYIEVKKGG